MIKSQLIAKLAAKMPDLPEKDVAECVNTILQQLMESLVTAGRAEIRNFGSFTLHYHASRLAHNPKTGEKLMTDPKYAIHFKPGKGMKERIDASKDLPITNGTASDTDEDE